MDLLNKEISTGWVLENAGEDGLKALGLDVDSKAQTAKELNLLEKEENNESEDTSNADQTAEEDVGEIKVENEVKSEVKEEVEDKSEIPQLDILAEIEKGLAPLVELLTGQISDIKKELTELKEQVETQEVVPVKKEIEPEVLPFASLVLNVKEQLSGDGFVSTAEVTKEEENIARLPEEVVDNTQVTHPLNGLVPMN